MSLVRNAVIRSPDDYRRLLDDYWLDAKADRSIDAPTVISTFAGCGGSSLGYHMAGYRELLASDWDDHAAKVFRTNFPEVPMIQDDIAELTSARIMELAGISAGELDVFDGSPPCQGFSTAGRRILEDDRNELFREYVRILRDLQPRAFVMENVSGMVKGKMRLVFVECLRELKASGYRVSARVLDASYFNVPQMRKRLIIIGVREDLGVDPSHPAPTSWPLSLERAIDGMVASRSDRRNPWIGKDRPAATILKSTAGYLGIFRGESFVGTEEGPPDQPKLDDAYGQLWDQIKPGESSWDVVGKGFSSCNKPRPDKPCFTLMKTCTGRGFATMVHPRYPRALTIDEAKLIQSIPLQFDLTDGSYSERWSRIGNSVPPLLMRSIALHIRESILQAIDART